MSNNLKHKAQKKQKTRKGSTKVAHCKQMVVLQTFLDLYYGGVYSEEFELFSDGGPTCASSMTN